MPRTQKNDNFIDKSFTVMADLILKLLPAAQGPDGSLNQAALASAAFSDSALLKQLERLQWPVRGTCAVRGA